MEATHALRMGATAGGGHTFGGRLRRSKAPGLPPSRADPEGVVLGHSRNIP